MKIEIIKCEKAENCFANARSYVYTLSTELDDNILSQMKSWGELKVRRNFRRPFFLLALADGIQAKGVLQDSVVKAGFSHEKWEEQKTRFETLLKSLELTGENLGQTQSVCPVCLEKTDAVRIRYGAKVYLEKTCKEHGFFRTLIWNGKPSYETFQRQRTFVSPVNPAVNVSRGCPDDCGLCPEHRQRTCCVLMEVTSRCSLGCPVCFASSGTSETAFPDPSLEDIRHRFQAMLDCGGPFNIQLSGGEPTEREDLDEIIRMGKSMGFPFFQLNTNGLRIGQEPEYLQNLAKDGLDCVFLQFDGLRDSTYITLRGRPFLKEKLDALEACRKAGVGVVLVPVIAPGVNNDEIGKILDFALEHMPTVRGVHFQPVSHFGRCQLNSSETRFTLPDLLREIERQTQGRMKTGDFTPGNAENPYCSFSGNFTLQEDGSLRPWKNKESCGCGVPQTSAAASGSCCQSSTIDAAQTCCTNGSANASHVCCTSDSENASRKAREFVARQWSLPEQSAVQDASCGCGIPSGSGSNCCSSSLDIFLERTKKYTLAVSAMAFMDAWNLDLERLKECYIHVVTGEEKVRLIPFCAYNLTAIDGTTKYRGREKQ